MKRTRDDAIAALYVAGWSLNEIAEVLGIPYWQTRTPLREKAPELFADLMEKERQQREKRMRNFHCVRCGGEARGYPRAKYCDKCVGMRAIESGQTEAAKAVARAVRSGALKPASGQVCADCGGLATEYDHRDYNKPLDVVAVCRGCNARRGPAISVSAAKQVA